MLQPHPGSWLVDAQQKLEDLFIKILIGYRCHPWTLSLISITAMLFAIGLASAVPQKWSLGQRLLSAVCYLIIVGSIILIRCLL